MTSLLPISDTSLDLSLKSKTPIHGLEQQDQRNFADSFRQAEEQQVQKTDHDKPSQDSLRNDSESHNTRQVRDDKSNQEGDATTSDGEKLTSSDNASESINAQDVKDGNEALVDFEETNTNLYAFSVLMHSPLEDSSFVLANTTQTSIESKTQRIPIPILASNSLLKKPLSETVLPKSVAAEGEVSDSLPTIDSAKSLLNLQQNQAKTIPKTPILAETNVKEKLDIILNQTNTETPLTQINKTMSELTMTTPQVVTSHGMLAKPAVTVSIPFNQPQWGQAVAERIVWMHQQGIQEAEVHLDPPELGPLQVKIAVANETAQVQFVVQHANVKDALDQSAMRLREMFEGEGFTSVDVDVSDQSQQQAAEKEDNNDSQSINGSQVGEESEQNVTHDSSEAASVNMKDYSLVNAYV